jgi:hypothetical protein
MAAVSDPGYSCNPKAASKQVRLAPTRETHALQTAEIRGYKIHVFNLAATNCPIAAAV